MTTPKSFGILASILSFFTTPLFYSFFWYSKNCSNKESSLINHLGLSMSLCGVATSIYVSILEVYLAVSQPAHPFLCGLSVISRNVIASHFMCIFGTIYVVKYVYIFIYKNPVGGHDGFWCCFINMAIFQLQVVFHTAFFLCDFKLPYNFYICSNTLPLPTAKRFLNLPLNGSFIVSVASYIFVEFKVKLLKRKEKKVLIR